MSNKSGTSSQVISLPKGGGTLRGIGEKFTPDLYTGTGNFTVPIALPPGRNGFQPQLSLVYSTGNGNSPFGLGWSLSIPGVSRKTSHGVPRYHEGATDPDERDTFILSGTEDLVPLESDTTSTRYRPRTEGLFAQIIHHHDIASNHNYWKVRGKDGLISRYGTPGTASSDLATIADPRFNMQSRIFAWKLTNTEDLFGNRIEYHYKHDRNLTQPYPWDQAYLREIRYIDYTNNAGATDFLVTVEFEYDQIDLTHFLTTERGLRFAPAGAASASRSTYTTARNAQYAFTNCIITMTPIMVSRCSTRYRSSAMTMMVTGLRRCHR
jgi:hypothetical protein